jgi:hypothetical protein
MDEHARLLTEAHNFAIVQLPGRRYPGVVFQGDSLHNLLQSVHALRHLASKNENVKLLFAIDEMHKLLTEVEDGLIHVCKRDGIELPFGNITE